MEAKRVLNFIMAGFAQTKAKANAERRDNCLADAAVAEIALMIAALDGCVLPEEFAAYRWIVGRCSRLTEGEEKKRLADVVDKAGRLLMMAQVGAYSEMERLTAFGGLVRETLPSGFASCSLTDIRRSFVLWLSMALSDGEYSEVERQAIGLLRSELAADVPFETGFFETAERLLRDLVDPLRRADAEADLDRLVVFAGIRG